MSENRFLMVDGNEATTLIAHACNEVMAIYPITPSSTMGELADEWAAKGKKNIFGTIPQIIEMQSEAGAAGAVHGSLQGGSMTCTFTASQGLLLMIPIMFKVAGEQTPTVFHVTARTIATHALAIFGDHSDILACRSTGWAMLCGGTVQETHDTALIAYAATYKTKIPFVHFFDGFRTSHEVNRIEPISDDAIKQMLDINAITEFRKRALTPDNPLLRGTAQNPDVFFQSREGANCLYNNVPEIVQAEMNKLAKLTGRQYHIFDYFGHPEAEHVIVSMASSTGVIEEFLDEYKKTNPNAKIGLVNVRLYRPFASEFFVKALPKTVKKIAVLDRTKEPGSAGEPLYQDVVTAISEFWQGEKLFIAKGRYGLASKEFSPTMVKTIYDELAKPNSKKEFTVGINDDVTNLSLSYDPNFSTEAEDVRRCLFFGLGSDGTVGANKDTTKIVGENTDLSAQGYFVYDSKKAGSVTESHLRFSPRPIKGSYFVTKANFVACHQFVFTEKLDMLAPLVDGGTFLLNSPYGANEVWNNIPAELQKEIIDKKAKFYVVDAVSVAREAGMGNRLNTVMQTCFFQLAKLFQTSEEAIGYIKKAIKKTYGKKGDAVVEKNYKAVDASVAALREVNYPQTITSQLHRHMGTVGNPPKFVKETLGEILAARGNDLPVSALPADGTFPTGTSQYEKRNIAIDIPIWDPNVCIHCGQCSLVCPHAAIRIKKIDAELMSNAPASFQTADWKGKEYPAGTKFVVQPAPDDCVGCGLCVHNCPAKNKTAEGRKAINMENKINHLDNERANWDFFASLPEADRAAVNADSIKGSQLLLPLFEFSGACAGCGETPYVKLITQFFGDRMLVGNATGCSSIYGGNLPTTPYTKDANGRGPAWCNSLFEDNAEFALGLRLAVDQQNHYAKEIITARREKIGETLVENILGNKQENEAEIAQQRKWVAELKEKVNSCLSQGTCDSGTFEACATGTNLLNIADSLVRRSCWAFGGDGWAYDIGYGGLDHVIASGRDINILVLDTEVYSNTGGQASKSTPKGAVAKFAASGKPTRKKDLGMMGMAYGTVFVAQIALGANPTHAIKAIRAAESYPGPSLIIAYAHCIAHGMADMKIGLELQKEAVKCGYWLLYSYDPRKAQPLEVASKMPEGSIKDFVEKQNRFGLLKRNKPEVYENLIEQAQTEAVERFASYSALAGVKKS
ncbi:MAG: pyruvate:ferredoxin (flavodoxin) oxidoreductase [Planctomycetaceae bacterium]|nr:pyruvate:ferredoxin (flavodoxin) oxidoreductase [Planctomycetaceae bacterium]